MIPLERVPASPREIRNFGLLFALLALLAGVWFLWKGWGGWEWLAGLAGFFLLTGLAVRSVLRPVYIGWMYFAQVLAWVNTRVILTLFFYLVMTPVGLALRLLGKDPMHRRPDPEGASYWIIRTPEPYDPARSENLF